MMATASPLKQSTRRNDSQSGPSRVLGEAAAASAATSTPTRSNSKGKQRAVFCDVVVEDTQCIEGHWTIPFSISQVLPGLGKELDIPTASPAFPTTPSKVDSLNLLSNPLERPPNDENLQLTLRELLKTEENYVSRIRTLHDLYAQPLRAYAHNRDTEIIPLFAAKQMFGNIELILAANQAFLADLSASLKGTGRRENWASAILRHISHFSSVYPKYMSNLNNAQAMERELRSKNKRFASFVEKTREAAAEGRANSSLDSLLVEPFQRMPRYKLLIERLLKEIPIDSSMRSTLVAALEIACQVSVLDEDEQTRRAAALFGLAQVIDGLPARFTSSGRYFVDCIDVLDTPLPGTDIPSHANIGDYAAHTAELFCTIFLFNDQIVIAKRETTDRRGGRALVGLDNINKLASDMRMQRSTGSRSPWKGRAKTMKFKGAFDLGELVAKDAGNLDFRLYLQHPPHQVYASEKWNGRPLRAFRIVKPETPVDKSRFLKNIWQSTAHLKGQGGGYRKALLLRTQDLSAYWNLYDRQSYTLESRKSKIALQLCASNDAAPLDFSSNGPQVVISARMYDGASCSYSIYTRIGETTRSQHATSDFPALTRVILETAIQHEALPRSELRRTNSRLDRQTSHASLQSPSKALSQSVSRNVMDFMLSPGREPGSPRRTLSRGSRTSTADSRMAASIFSGEYAEPSSAATSVQSHGAAQDDHGQSSLRGPASVPTKSSLLGRRQQTADMARHGSQSERRQRGSLYQAQDSLSSRQLAGADSMVPDADSSKSIYDSSTDASATLGACNPRRATSLSSLRQTTSNILNRSHSGPLARSLSVQSMHMVEEEEVLQQGEDDNMEELLAPRTPPRNMMSPIDDRMLSPTPLKRSGTVSRPNGPRQLGSRSPASPSGMAGPRSRSAEPNPRAPVDENDPFLSRNVSPSMSKKRSLDYEDDELSTSSKRAQRETTPADVRSDKCNVTTQSRNVSSSRQGPARVEPLSHTASRFANRDLNRVGSLPRSPHTRSLYQQSRDQSDSQQSLYTPSSSASRIHRKPVPNLQREVSQSSVAADTAAMEVDLLRQQSADEKSAYEQALKRLKDENDDLRQALHEFKQICADLQTKLDSALADRDAELDRMAIDAAKMANDRIDEHAAAIDAEAKALREENVRLKNERRALQALLKKQTPTKS